MSTSTEPVLRRSSFQGLIARLSEVLGSSGIGADHVSEKQLCDIMDEYDSNPEDWMPLITKWPDASQPYVRNLVDHGNGQYNLVSVASDIKHDMLIHVAYIGLEARF